MPTSEKPDTPANSSLPSSTDGDSEDDDKDISTSKQKKLKTSKGLLKV